MARYPDVPKVSYADARTHIQAGDLLLCSGSSFFSTMIQRRTKSVWSHVGILHWRQDIERLMVMESVESKGTQTVPAHQYLRNYRQSGAPYPGRVYTARHAGLAHLTPAQWIFFEQYAVDHFGYDYNEEEIRRILVAILTPKLARKHPGIAAAKSFICSEYAAACLEAIDIHIVWNPRGYIAPADFANDPAVTVLWELVP